MSEKVLELYPEYGSQRTLKGLYLDQKLRQRESGVFVYANFNTSLDGRIAISGKEGELSVPDMIINPRDWRLFQELAVQADILLSSGRYLRDYADGRAQEILRIYDDPRLADLANWRQSYNLPLFPAIAVISASLEFPIPSALIENDRQVVILTTQQAPDKNKQALEDQGLQVLIAGEEHVDGGLAVNQLSSNGFQKIYSAAGPKVLHLLLEAGVLDRLYLTTAMRMLGGASFSTMLEGALLREPADFILRHLYHDSQTPGPGGQLFAAFDITLKN